ncbi:DUF2225 domain-containing protein [Mobilitalea sibirica]|uniref:DUF2225 domain-containing protein n=1 Tax=Mobilitalea sibirica TaxID=1462919 RepID=A0A8J7KXB1_9FIRM|nr:DUF2225 domain-containing protein [Mobilitalea sibirica]MBH1941577.1 DUF2225 domain-containing protein [Mobilitalea sibirica]
MSNLFSGLEAFGLGNLSKIDVYDEKEKEDAAKKAAEEKPTFSEEDSIFDKSYTCPVCDKEFKSKAVKSGKVKLLTLDSDLRPKYQFMDPLKYDAIVCPHCGFAALNRFFKYVTNVQAALIKKNISVAFRGLKESGDVLSYDEAIARHKLALVNSIVKKAKTSERAYTCLKTAWLIRGKNETLSKDLPDYKNLVNSLEKEEMEFITNAYDGFEEAFSKESFPMCGMDESTITLLVAELARRCGKTDAAGRWISKVLTSRDSHERIKAKAREIKELIKDNK